MYELQIQEPDRTYMHGKQYNTRLFDELRAISIAISKLAPGTKYRMRGEEEWKTAGEAP